MAATSPAPARRTRELGRGAHAAHRSAPPGLSAAPRPRRPATVRARSACVPAAAALACGPRHYEPVAARSEVAHVRARLGGGPGDTQLVGGVAQARVHELAPVAGERGIHDERRARPLVRAAARAEQAARGDRRGADESE